MTNREFSETNHQFIEDCRKANIPSTSRQARKYRRGEGLAYDIKKMRIRDEIFKPRHHSAH